MFADALYVSADTVGDTDNFVTDLGGDSLSAIGILAQIEEQYSIEINDDDFAKMTCVKEVAEKIYELTKK